MRLFQRRPPDVNKLKAEKDLKGLCKALQYKKDYPIRRDAAIALGEIGDPAALPALKEAIDDEKLPVQKQAQIAIAKIGTPDAIQMLAESLGSPKPGVQNVASDTLTELGEKAVMALIEMLDQANATARMNAARVLGRIKDPRAVDALIQRLADPDPQVRRWSVFALKMTADPRAVLPLSKMTDDPDTKVRDSVIGALEAFGDESTAGALAANLSHPEEHIREQTVSALDRLNWQPTRDSAGAWYWITKANWQKCKSIGEPAVEPLIKALRSERAEVKKTAVSALGAIKDVRAVEPLIALLEEKQYFEEQNKIRASICKVLGRIGGDRAAAALIKTYQDNEGRNIQTDAVNGLKLIGAPAVARVMEMYGGISRQKKNASEILGRLKAAEAFDPLLKMLQDKNNTEESFITHAKAMAALYKAGVLSEAQKQKLLQADQALHYRISSKPHVDNDKSCSRHWDYYGEHSDRHIDFHDFI